MKVQIEGNLYLESDSFQYIIKEYTGAVSIDKKTKKETPVYNIHGYFTQLPSAIKKLIRMKLHESTVTDLRSLLAEVQRVEKWAQSISLEDAAPLPFTDECFPEVQGEK